MEYLIIIPTYNEAENIKKLLKVILDLKLVSTDILVVDDNSPDGTSQKIKDLVKSQNLNNKVYGLDRKKKEGLGKAYIAGFKWALLKNYDKIITMDADFSHHPKYLTKLLKESEKYDVIVGSRYIKGGKVVGWSWGRYLNSRGANIFTRAILGLKLKDVTAGYKCYSARFLRAINFNDLVSPGYAFQVEMLNLAQEGPFSIKEIPITFTDRRVGQSKISGELYRSAIAIIRLAVRKQIYRQFIKFSIVGISGMAVDWLVYFTATRWLRLFYLSAKIISFIFAATNNYIWNRAWTFRSKEKKIAKEFYKFISVSVIGLSINAFIMYLIVGIFKLNDLLGWLSATMIVLFWNFIIIKFWVFKK